MRLLRLVVSSTLLVAAGCSGKAATDEAPTEDVEAASPERAAAPTLPQGDPAAATPAEDPTASPGSLGSAGGDAGVEAGGGTDAGSGASGGGSKCVTGSIAETEANDTAAAANELPGATGSFCGRLSAASDVDFVKFTLPAEATSLAYKVSLSANGVKVELTVGDKTFGPGQALVFVPGGLYVAKLSTTGTAPVDYRLDLEIKK